MLQKLAVGALGLLVLAGIGYNVWSWRSAPTPTNASPAAASAPTPAAITEAALAPLAVPTPPPMLAPSLVLTFDAGTIETQLSLKVNDRHAPDPAAVEFDETVPAIFASFTSTLPTASGVNIVWRRLKNGAIPEHVLDYSSVPIPAGQASSDFVKAPREGFLPGEYELQVSINNINPKVLPFRVTSKYVDAREIVAAESVPGLNVALAALGGSIASSNAGLKASNWAVANLIDGFPFQIGGSGCSNCGWTSGRDEPPYEIVFALAGDQPITIEAVVIDPSTEDTTTGGDWDLIPRNVEVSASAVSATDGFVPVGAARIVPRAVEQLVRIPPTPARFVKLRILSNWGGNSTRLGEVKVLEAAGPSALARRPRNLALPGLGGVVARFSSQDSVATGVQHLIDGELGEPWVSSDQYLPQDFVFAFKDDQIASIDRVVLRPQGRAPETWPRKVSLSVSTTSLFDFAEVGVFDLPKEARDHELRVGAEGRFLRVRVLENHGAPTTSLNEIRIFEGFGTDYTSVLARTAPLAGPAAATASTVTADSEEREANNDVATANPLTSAKSIGGTIEPLGELDHFSLQVPSGSGRQVLSLAISGTPFIKTSVSLIDAAGAELKRFDPAQARGATANVSWLVEPGAATLRVSEPPASIVLVWDTSGSMNGMTEALREAVLAYLDQVRPTEQLNLIRFSDGVEVLLKDFSSDRNILRNAADADKFYPDGGTKFYDAVEQAVNLLKPRTGNRAIIVLSDGEDSLSRMAAPAFWRLLQEEQVRLYTIGLGVGLKGFATRIGSTGQRFMGHASYATNGRAFFARDTSELKTLYDRIATELRAVSRYVVTPTIGSALGTLVVAATGERIASVSAPPRLQLVLDASGSMNRRIGNKRMIDSAKEVLTALIKGVPDDVQIGLRVYGHRIREGRPGACEDSQQLQPIARLDRARLLARVQGIAALGTTPIAYSLAQVAADLGDATGPQMVVLVTDGREECGGDPKAAVAALKAKGLDVRVNIVGFALTDQAAQRQLADAAALTGGTYVNAKDDSALKDAIDAAMQVPFEVHDSSGALVATGQVGREALKLPEGTFTVTVQTADRPMTIPGVRVEANRESRVELKKEGREIGIKVNQP